MYQIGSSINKETHEFVSSAKVPDTTSNYIDLTEDEAADHGFAESRQIKSERVATPEVVDITDFRLNSIESQEAGDRNNCPDLVDSRILKDELPVTSNIVEISSSRPRSIKSENTGEKNDGPGVFDSIPIGAKLAVTLDMVEANSNRPASITSQETRDCRKPRCDASEKDSEQSHSHFHNAPPVDPIGTTKESDAHSTSSDSSGSEVDDEQKDKTYEEGSERFKTNKKKEKSRRMAKTAREFFAMLQEKQKLLRQERLKKNSKTKHGSGKGKAPKNLASEATSDLGMVAQLQQDVWNGESIRDPVATSMPEMSTYTHAEQLKIIGNSIPEGSDIRRSKTQKRDLKQAVKSFGYRVLKAHNGDWLHKDMETALYSYQITATSWMMQRELIKAGPAAGGIIADEMGMGKTLMSLACMVGNPPDETDLKKFTRSTLIIVPNLAVAEQWREEARKHLSKDIAKWVLIYSAKSDTPNEMFQLYWMV
ncbi:hypothetical protein E4U21_006768 [Claviceps maximensis]|nr:hypothetical protein E4U21_006768 [Claviceps maximensis]